ncbi:MAG: cohesin domain-containing protein, partial [bacterium]|nr:cohesin domain-containing protein [bacterium]
TITLGALLLPAVTFASAITLAPTSVATVAGNTFSVTVGVNPTSGKAYTVRANLSFDPSMITLTSFSFASKWMALPQEGYDTEDNVSGVLVKTGGYPGGIIAQTTLGTATFRAKKTGTATISATSESLILDANNQNTVTGSQGQVSVIIAVKAPSAPVQTVTESIGTTSSETVVTESQTTETASTSNDATPQTASALSALDNILTLGTGSAVVASLVTIIVMIIGSGIWFWRRQRSDF